MNRDGFRPDPSKIEPVLEYPAPKNLKQLRRFLGMASWYRKFLDNFATIADPLTQLTKKSAKYQWGESQQSAFEQIKALIASAPVLHRPSFDDQFVIQTDASDTGLGAVLTQTIDGDERVLSFASRTLNKAERNYSVTERECLAVLWAIRKFRAYVEGYHFQVITDHSSLKWLCNLRNPNGRLARWALELQAYDYDIVHRKGSLNYVPDALSRMYEDDESEETPISSIEPSDSRTKDKWYDQLVTQVLEKPTAHPYFKIVAGHLYHYRLDPTLEDILDDQDAWKMVLRADKIPQVLRESHCEPPAGHLGRRKTYERIARYFYWKNMYREVSRFVRACTVCQQCKVEQLVPGGLMGKRRVSGPWEVVASDIMGPFPRSTRGYSYILIFMDTFTRWIEVVPIRKADGNTIKKELNERVFLRFGVPDIFLSDNGTEFRNKLLDKFLADHGTEHHTIPPYHAQANPVERVNRTVKTMVTSFIENEHKNWDKFLPELTFAYNTATQESTGVSPAFLNMGRHPTPPHNTKRAEEQAARQAAEQLALKKWEERMCKLFDLRLVTAKRAQRASERQSKYYNAKRRHVEFKIDDLVWKRNRILSSAIQGINAKLAPKYAGPFRITARLGQDVYRLEGENSEVYEKIHVVDLKPYKGGEEVSSDEEPLEDPTNRDGAEDTPLRTTPPEKNVVNVEAPRKRGRPRKTREKS